MNRLSYIGVFCIILLSVGSCVRVPDGILDEKQMENLLYEIHMSEGLSDVMVDEYISRQNKEIHLP